jgi:hypothetical protein
VLLLTSQSVSLAAVFVLMTYLQLFGLDVCPGPNLPNNDI